MKKVLFYPDPPVQLPGHSLSKTIASFILMGYELTNDIDSDWDIAVHWNIQDVNKTPDKLLKDERRVINRHLNDVTKSNVDRVFTEVFKYSSLIDDTSRFGYCVRKSDKQSAHDGMFVRMPCVKEEGYVYQLLLDNRISINEICDIRIPYFFGKIPLLFLKSRTIAGTFEVTLSKTKKYWITQVSDYLHISEVKKVNLFCEKIGLDVGEIDTIRDNSTGRLYLIDVNNIPGGHVFDYIQDGETIKRNLAAFFKDQIE